MAGSKIKKKEIELKRQIILEEALKLIDKVGFKDTKMEDIAKNVGFSKASLYSYFRDKEEIAMHIFGKHLLKLYNQIRDLPEKNISAVEKLSVMRSVHEKFLKRSKNFVVIRPNLKMMQKIHSELIELKEKIYGILKSIIEQGKKEKVFNKDLDIDLTANLLDAMMTGIIFVNSVFKTAEKGILPEYKIDEMTDFAMDFFYLGISNTNTEICK